MFNNPYFGGFNGYREQSQQPITQNFQLSNPLPSSSDLFMAQFLDKGQKVEEVFINHKTAFIDLINKELAIKEVNGNVMRYGLILPKDEKDLKIEALEKQINELKGMMVNEQSNIANVSTGDESTKPTTNGKKLSGK